MTGEKRPNSSPSLERKLKSRKPEGIDRDAPLAPEAEGSEIGRNAGSANARVSFTLQQEIKRLVKHHENSLPVLRSVMDGHITITNGNDLASDGNSKSAITAQWAVRKFISALKTSSQNQDSNCKSGFQTIFHCKNGCMAFTGHHRRLTKCLRCGSEKSKYHYYYYFSIREAIRAIFDDRANAVAFRSACEELYGPKRTAKPWRYTDFWSGKWFEELRNTPITGDHSSRKIDLSDNYFDPDSIEVSVTMMADTVKPWTNRELELVTVVLVNNNLPYDQRFLNENTLIAMAFPKPDQSEPGGKKLDQTFLTPLIDDFAEMASGFKVLDAKSRKEVTVKVHLTQVSADMQACGFVMNMTGESGERPCMACYSTNERRGALFDNEVHLRTRHQHESESRRSDELLKDKKPELEDHIRKTGVEGSAELLRLSSVAFPWSFIPDLTQLLYASIGRQIFEIFRNALTAEEQEKLDKVVDMLNGNLPTSMGGSELPLQFFTKGTTWNASPLTWKMMCKLAPYFLTHLSRVPGSASVEILNVFKGLYLDKQAL